MTSTAELTLKAQLEQAGIPFEREYRFAKEAMGREWRADFLVFASRHWPVRGRVLVEIDGGGWVQGHHSRGKGIEDDAEKQSAAAILGYRVIRCTPAQVNDGRALEWIRAALGLDRGAVA